MTIISSASAIGVAWLTYRGSVHGHQLNEIKDNVNGTITRLTDEKAEDNAELGILRQEAADVAAQREKGPL